MGPGVVVLKSINFKDMVIRDYKSYGNEFLNMGDGQVGVSPKGPKGFPDRMDRTISNNGHSTSRVFLSTLVCNHYAQLQRFLPFQSTFSTHHKESGILQSFKSPFLDCLDLCLHNVDYCNFGNNIPMSIYI
jgi:hypothetical protein